MFDQKILEAIIAEIYKSTGEKITAAQAQMLADAIFTALLRRA